MNHSHKTLAGEWMRRPYRFLRWLSLSQRTDIVDLQTTAAADRMAVSLHSPAALSAAQLYTHHHHHRHRVMNGSSSYNKKCILGARSKCGVGNEYYFISNTLYFNCNKKEENQRPACLISLYNSKSKRHWSTKSAPFSIPNRARDSVKFPPIRFHISDRFSGFAAMADPLNNGSSSLPSKRASLTTSDQLRHVESMATLPSGAGKIPRLNAVILGEVLASEEDDLVIPSQDFSAQALVPSPQEVCFLSLRLHFWIVWSCSYDFATVQYLELYRRSIEDPAGFWSDIASEFYWKQKWGNPVCSENFDVRKGRINIEVIFPSDLFFDFLFLHILYTC